MKTYKTGFTLIQAVLLKVTLFTAPLRIGRNIKTLQIDHHKKGSKSDVAVNILILIVCRLWNLFSCKLFLVLIIQN